MISSPDALFGTVDTDRAGNTKNGYNTFE